MSDRIRCTYVAVSGLSRGRWFALAAILAIAAMVAFAGSVRAAHLLGGTASVDRAGTLVRAASVESLAEAAFAGAGARRGLEVSNVLLNVAPATPTIVSPMNGSIVPTTNPVLTVSSTDADGDPISYQFQLSTVSSFATIVCQSGWLTTTQTWTLPDKCVTNDLNSPGAATWYWRAQAKDSTGNTSAWTASQSLHVNVALLGGQAYWPMWTHGPVAVNAATGNLALTMPGLSVPSIVGAMGVQATYNSFDATNIGLGPGWTFNAPSLGDAPTKLIDHRNLTGSAKLDAVELKSAYSRSRWFNRLGDAPTFIPSHGHSGAIVSQNSDNTWTFIADSGAVYTYGVENASGVATLTSAQDPQAKTGGVLTYTFSSTKPDEVTSITDPSGRKLNVVWNNLDATHCASPALVCVSLVDPGTAGTVVTWKYNKGATGSLSSVSDGTNTLYQLTYNASGQITTIQNADDLQSANRSPNYNTSHAVTLTYDTSGRVATVADGPVSTQPAGKQTSTWSFTYHVGPFNLSATRAAHAGIAQGTVRQANRETDITPPNQHGAASPKTVKTFVDGLGHVLEIDDLLGHVSEYQYDYNDKAHLEWSEDKAGNPTDNTWDAVNDVLTQTQKPDAGLGRPTTTYRYDEQTIGTASTAGAPAQGLQGWYWSNANQAGIPASKQTDANVDFNWGTTGPAALGQGSGYSVRWFGDVVLPSAGDYTFSTISSDGTRLTLDSLRAINNWVDQGTTTIVSQPINLAAGAHTVKLDFKKDTGAAEVHLHWSCADCSPSIPDQVIPAANLRPAWENQTSTVSPNGEVSFSHFADPAISQPDYTLAQDSGTNYITSFTYDNYGRVTQKVMPKGNAGRTIDASGNLLGSSDATYATSYTYYAATGSAAASSCNGTTSYNQAGQLQSKSPAGLTATTYIYDARGNVLQKTNAAGTTCNTYNAEGLLASNKAPGDTNPITYTYDPAGQLRIVAQTGNNQPPTTNYDEAGRVANFTDGVGAISTNSYDQDGNLTQRVDKASTTGTAYTTAYTYDDADEMTGMTDPGSKAYSFYYDTIGNLHATQYPNGTFSWVDRNTDNDITAIYNRHGSLTTPLPGSVPADSQSSPIADYAYTYNLDGQNTQEVRTGGGLTTETTNYSYDNLGRLSQVTLPSGTGRVYSYDLDSNRLQTTENGTVISSYTYNPTISPGLDELTSVTQGGNTTSYGYSADGQVNSRGSDTLTWDGRGRNTGGTFGGTSVTYTYDPAGAIKKRVGGSTTTWYALGGMWESTGSTWCYCAVTLTEVQSADGSTLGSYAGLPPNATLTYLYYNGHGDLAAEANAAAARSAADTYDPFGTLSEGSAPPNATSKRWAARWHKRYDSQSGLLQLGMRAYDPTLGRFYSSDPVEGGALNTYDYAGQDPLDNYDLNGGCYRGAGSDDSSTAVSLNSVVLGPHKSLCAKVDRIFNECYAGAWGRNDHPDDETIRQECWTLVNEELGDTPGLWAREPLPGDKLPAWFKSFASCAKGGLVGGGGTVMVQSAFRKALYFNPEAFATGVVVGCLNSVFIGW
jgi:RHS repeat-associated protein